MLLESSLNDREHNVAVLKDVWDDARRSRSRTAIFAPTGEGKSFLANNILREYFESGVRLVIIDLGGSYTKFAKLYPQNNNRQIDSTELKREQKIEAKELGLEHQLFFAASPKPIDFSTLGNTDETIYVVVDGDQIVTANTRIRMRLTKSATVNGKLMPKNTSVFGFISFQPNRALIEIENIKHHPTKLKAFDLQDGSEGIYVENNFRAEATREVLDDVIGDINIPSVPQVGGLTQVFLRSNRRVKVTVLNNYRLILKADNRQ